ncbi:MAG: hypothetical protein ACR2PX_00270 [Endozoicomonas sp.]
MTLSPFYPAEIGLLVGNGFLFCSGGKVRIATGIVTVIDVNLSHQVPDNIQCSQGPWISLPSSSA